MGNKRPKSDKKQPDKSAPFTKRDFDKMLDKAIHPEKRKPDKE